MRLLIFIVLQFTATLVVGQSYRFMTYNIRFDNPGDGVNAWNGRRAKVATLLSQYHPDILGVQEALHQQLEDIVKDLPEFTYVGVGRDDGKTKGEYSAILIRKDKFDVLEQNTFWLSETPEIAGSKNWDAMITRVATWAKVKDRKSKKIFFVINTHFDHIGVEARKQSAIILKNFITKLPSGTPAIVMGDFNCIRDQAPYAVMMAKEGAILNDPAPQNPPGTFCNFEVNSMVCLPIDYIFNTAQWTPEEYTVITDNDGKYYPSDHLPVLTKFVLTNPKKSSRRD